jgi:EAL domain-containing protein (putative c-di-GMP-specific phosphodiesterase class I)
VLYYQPKFGFESRRVRGLEALLRWPEPEHGFVRPEEFVPLLEETGMIIDAGLWVIEQAVADAASWRRMGLAVPRIAVNVSQVQLQHKDFVASVLATLGSGDPTAIDLEITESMFNKDPRLSAEKLGALRAIGMRVFIDDFGTGYSNLSQLARLPFDALKIDQSFVARIATHPQDLAIVSAICSLAKAMRVLVVAEGVETEEQAALLSSLGCDEAQGHLFGRAVSAEEIGRVLAAG